MKPRLTLADLEALQRVKALRWGQQVYFGEQVAYASGIMGSSPVFKIKGRNVTMQPGDPRLRTMKVPT